MWLHPLGIAMMHMHFLRHQHPIGAGGCNGRADAFRGKYRIALISRMATVHLFEGDSGCRAFAAVCTRCGVGADVEGGGATLHDVHELVEDDEFEAQLETVDGGFEDGLDLEEVGVFGAEQGDVEEDDEYVDPDEM